jgi:acyl carrier protein
MHIIRELTSVFQMVFDDDDITLKRSTTATDIDGWDSLSHITLLMAVEDHFDVEFGRAEIVDLADVGALIDLIDQKLSVT